MISHLGRREFQKIRVQLDSNNFCVREQPRQHRRRRSRPATKVKQSTFSKFLSWDEAKHSQRKILLNCGTVFISGNVVAQPAESRQLEARKYKFIGVSRLHATPRNVNVGAVRPQLNPSLMV